MQPEARNPRARKWLKVAALLVLSAAIAAWLVTLTPMWRNRPIRFESARWLATPAIIGKNSLRQRMVDDLLRSRQLEGKTHAEVLQLIGTPDQTGYPGKHDLVYMTGPERDSFIGIDYEWLIVTLDETGRVVSVRLHNS